MKLRDAFWTSLTNSPSPMANLSDTDLDHLARLLGCGQAPIAQRIRGDEKAASRFPPVKFRLDRWAAGVRRPDGSLEPP